MAGWSIRDKLSYPSKLKLHIQVPNQRSDWDLHIFSINSNAQSSRRFGGLNVYERPRIPIPFPTPDGDFTLLVGDWYKASHKTLQQFLDSRKSLPFPDTVLINGRNQSSFSGDQGKTYMFRISNVGLSTSLNFRIQGHKMKLVEVEGSHTIQNIYDSLNVHVGQSVAVLVTLDQPPKDYYIVASTRFTKTTLTATAVLHYSNSHPPVSGPLPAGPTYQLYWSIRQARSFRWNLTASAARPNPQGSYHYGKIPLTKTIVLANSAPLINGKQRDAVNRVSYINSDGAAYLATSVLPSNLHDFIETHFSLLRASPMESSHFGLSFPYLVLLQSAFTIFGINVLQWGAFIFEFGGKSNMEASL